MHPTRDFNYVGDTVAAFVALLESEKGLGEVINFGSGFEISVGDTVSMIADVMGATVEIETDAQRIRPALSEVERLWADNSKARELMGWSPAYGGRDGMRRGIAETVAWFTDPANLAQYKSNLYNI